MSTRLWFGKEEGGRKGEGGRKEGREGDRERGRGGERGKGGRKQGSEGERERGREEGRETENGRREKETSNEHTERDPYKLPTLITTPPYVQHITTYQ